MKKDFLGIKKGISLLAMAVIAIGLAVGSAVGAEQLAPNSAVPVSIQAERVTLTEAEAAFQKQHPVIRVAVDASWRPLEYVDKNTQKYDGVIPELLKRLSNYTGFKFEYVVMPDYEEALRAVAEGRVDMISGLANDRAMAQKYQVQLTKPYITINSAVVAKNSARDLYRDMEKKKIAVVSGDYANAAITERIPYAELVELSSNEACLEAVRADRVDVAIIAAYCAEYYMRVPKYSALNSYAIPDFSWEQSYGISNKQDKLLVAILNKGISKLSALDMNQAVYEGLTKAVNEDEWLLFVHKHPVPIIGGLLLIGIIIVALMSFIYISRKKAHARKLEDGMRLGLALARTHLCIWEIDVKTGDVLKIDNPQEKHGFYDLRQNVFQQALDNGYIHPEDVPVMEELRAKLRAGEDNVTGNWRIKNLPELDKESSYWWEQVLFKTIYDAKGHPQRIIGISEDITKEKLAQRDSLTSVYNRKSFELAAGRVLNERRNAYLQCAFLILDLDGFKKINDTYGHSMGDKVLMAVGSTLTGTFRSSDIVGRLGGDEFIVFMTAISKPQDAQNKAQELVNNISGIQAREGFPFAVNCSVGVVVAEKGRDDLAALYQKADIALYKAKNAGKNQYKIYE